MTCPSLSLYAASGATAADAGAFLGIDTSRGWEVAPETFVTTERIGRIGLSWASSPELDFGGYAAPWSLVLHLDAPCEWAAVRTHLVFDLCAALHERHPGTYLAVYDTGTVLFWLRGGELLLAESERESLSAYPLRFARHAFAALPPV